LAILALALLVDWLVGDPDFVWRRIPHPVVGFGAIIGWFDRSRDRGIVVASLGDDVDERHQMWGAYMLAALLAVCFVVWYMLFIAASFLGPFGWILEMLTVAVLIAQKSLRDHVRAVIGGLRNGGIEGGRGAVSMIVGRDVSRMNESGVSRAAIESLAENFSDGVVAPALWYAIGGIPGILFYKAVNTADSMVGHNNDEYRHFGRYAAKLDDLLNWPAARLSAALIVVAATVSRRSHKVPALWAKVKRDAPLHRSPNAGWPEAAFAVALELTLGGPRLYGEEHVDAPALGQGGKEELGVVDIEAAVSLFDASCIALLASVGLCWLVFG